MFGYQLCVFITITSFSVFVGADNLWCVTPKRQCPSDYVTFTYTNRNMDHEPVSHNDIAKLKQIIDPSLPTVIIIHGFVANSFDEASPAFYIQPHLLQENDYNIITVKWNLMAKIPCYLSAVRNVLLTSNCTAQIMDDLIDEVGIPRENIHVIGHSLGAQIAGNLHRFLRNTPVKRISALDAALPFFVVEGINHQLSSLDAEFVDVYHTDAGMFGQTKPVGHVDFYFNGGVNQPYCDKYTATVRVICNHLLSIFYYAESINSPMDFLADSCPSEIDRSKCSTTSEKRIVAGFHTPTNATGSYIVMTKDDKYPTDFAGK